MVGEQEDGRGGLPTPSRVPAIVLIKCSCVKGDKQERGVRPGRVPHQQQDGVGERENGGGAGGCVHGDGRGVSVLRILCAGGDALD